MHVDDNASIGYTAADAVKMPSETRTDESEVEIALRKSVELQSHYAGLLNSYDGGKRLSFKNAKEWVDRLKAMGVL